MKVLITGATGLIGRSLVDRLQAGGHTVAALTRDRVRAEHSMEGVERHQWAPGASLPSALMERTDAVVNLAGESVNGRWSQAKKARIMESRIEVTRAIADAMSASDSPKVLVNASAVGIYGDREDEVLTEDSASGEGFLKDVVKSWEDEAMSAGRHGSRVAIMRFGIVLAQDGGAMAQLLPLAKLGLNGPLGSGKQWWSWVHLDDATRAIEAALLQEMSGVFNVTAPQPVRQAQFAKSLGRVVHRPAFLPVPAIALRFAQGEFADELLFSKRVVSQRLLANGFAFLHPDLEEALAHLAGEEVSGENVPARA